MLFESFMLNLFVIIVLIVALTFDYITKFFSYWYVRLIPNNTPIPFFGTDYYRVLGLRSNTEEVNSLYAQYPKDQFVGSIKSRIPDLVLKDPDAIKTILSTDFADFHSRGLALNKSRDVCIQNNLFYAEGEKWTLLRDNLQSILNELKPDFEENLHNCLSGTNGDVNVQQLLSKVLDGVFKDILINQSSNGIVVTNMRTAVLRRNFMNKLKTYLKNIFPSLYTLFGMTTIAGEPSTETKRELENSKLLNIIRQANIFQLTLKDKYKKPSSDVDYAFALLATFITEGYVPCLNLLTALLYELARNPETQIKARSSEEYLNAVIKESLRLHPPYSVLTRQCVKMYHYPDRKLVIDKNVTVNVPVESIHRDEKYYNDAKTYNPERFLAEEHSSHSFAYLPFGAGPRKCLGEQLSMLICRSVAKAVLKNNVIEPTSITPSELKMADHNFSRVVNEEIWLRFIPTSSN
ncbi:unnamed protein product [Diatraea saccharalis]|uniref:unspecific monooxygenase n=1 Tax=Diatraea saccharalis TaxID=40085 RepID=A0A9N9QY69_9NEOP|nr:unnamed protein product [Diatraea saccharalis]